MLSLARNFRKILQSGQFFAPALQLLHTGIVLTGTKLFANRNLAEQGFPADRYDDILSILQTESLQQLSAVAKQLDGFEIAQAQAILARIADIQHQSDPKSHDVNQIAAVQNVLQPLAFGVAESLGRPHPPTAQLAELDRLGKGWLYDYHTIISQDAYLRLNSKPQVFRPGVGHTNTTTRGAHTQDVAAAAMQMARQLGLNKELCGAIAVLHDIGHPAGGHVGEQILTELSGRKFKHHIFSLSLADLFDFNLLREVQIGAFYHKSGGKKLQTPTGRPQEYGIVRIADKICYAPWDLFDAITNGYLAREQVPEWLFDTLGTEPLAWIRTMIQAMVRESAEAHAVQFTEASGKVYEAYQTARQIVFKQVHNRIHWALLEADIRLCYACIATSFPKLDPVPIVAYMTDSEVTRIARMVERQFKGKAISSSEFESEGMGFMAIVERLQAPGSADKLYYTSAKGNL